MLTAEIVAHCYRYSRLLTLHLSQLALCPPKEVQVTCIVPFTPSDSDTLEVLDYFGAMDIRNVKVRPYPMEPSRLFRRAIGRDELARETNADYLLYFDCDYLIDGQTLDAAVAEMATYIEPKLFYPRIIWESIDHQRGDAEILAVRRPGIYGITPERYREAKLPRAIGGAQWITGDTARTKGYLPVGHRFLRPEDAWRRTREDTLCRYHWGLDQVGLSVRGVRRCRHSDRGRENPECRL